VLFRSALLGLAYFAGFTGLFLVITLYLQDELGYTPLQAGLVGTPFAVASGISAWFSGRWVARWGRQLVVGGLLVVLVGVVAADAVVRVLGDRPGAVGPALAAVLLVAGAGSGTVIAPNQTLTLSEVPVTRAGVAGSMLQLGQRIGSAVGISVVLAVYYGGLASGERAAHAAGRALVVTIALVAVALVVGLLDLRSRRAEDRRTGRATGSDGRAGDGRAGPRRPAGRGRRGTRGVGGGEGRRLGVLRAGVEDYVPTGEPVGSRVLTGRHGLGVSPATIRNDMAA